MKNFCNLVVLSGLSIFTLLLCERSSATELAFVTYEMTRIGRVAGESYRFNIAVDAESSSIKNITLKIGEEHVDIRVTDFSDLKGVDLNSLKLSISRRAVHDSVSAAKQELRYGPFEIFNIRIRYSQEGICEDGDSWVFATVDLKSNESNVNVECRSWDEE